MRRGMDDGLRDVRLVIDPPEAGRRLDVVVAARVEGASRSAAQRWIRDGLVTVDEHPAKASQPVSAGSVVAITIPAIRPARLAAEDLPLYVLYEDADIAVVDKPAGMVVHPAAGHSNGTVVNALLHRIDRLSGIGGEARPGIVHRLDKGTSGVLVVAKHDVAHRALAKQFHDRSVHKTYLALVWGRPSAGYHMDAPLGRDPRHRKKYTTRTHRTREASTVIETVEPLGELSLVAVTIGTGRTHQIRVHLAESGFPIAGDETYGGVRAQVPSGLAAVGRLNRPFLHAARVSLEHPSSRQPMTFAAPLPADLESLLAALRRRAAPPLQ